jgi:hypothetical protein
VDAGAVRLSIVLSGETMRLATTFLVLLLVPRLAGAQQPMYRPYVPPNGFVPDSATAVRIAIAVWTPIYGPFDAQAPVDQTVVAMLKDGVWTVTRGVPSREIVPGFVVFGSPLSSPVDTAVVKIAKRDGRILYQGRT